MGRRKPDFELTSGFGGEGLLLDGSIPATTRTMAKLERAKIEVKVPNAATHSAIAELEAGKGKRFLSVKTLMDDLHSND